MSWSQRSCGGSTASTCTFYGPDEDVLVLVTKWTSRDPSPLGLLTSQTFPLIFLFVGKNLILSCQDGRLRLAVANAGDSRAVLGRKDWKREHFENKENPFDEERFRKS